MSFKHLEFHLTQNFNRFAKIKSSQVSSIYLLFDAGEKIITFLLDACFHVDIYKNTIYWGYPLKITTLWFIKCELHINLYSVCCQPWNSYLFPSMLLMTWLWNENTRAKKCILFVLVVLLYVVSIHVVNCFFLSQCSSFV